MNTTSEEGRWEEGGLEQLRRFVELLPVGAAFAEGESLLVNSTVERITGYRRGELSTVDTWFLTLFGEDAERVRRLYDLDRAAGFPSPRTVELVRRDGERRLTEFRAREAGGVVVWTLADVTERTRAEAALREMEEQFRQAQKMEAVGLLAGGVAHDFNNILTVIKGSAQLILEHETLDEQCREEVLDIARAAERGAELTRQLLTFSRRQVVHPRLVDVGARVRGAHQMLHRLLGESIVLHTIVEDELPPVYVDPGQLEQVLVNLVVNARDAMPTGGHVEIEMSRAVLDEADAVRHPEATAGEYVVLSVSDEGSGMDEPTIDRIFDPFFTTKEKGRGTGLGLPTVFGIVRQAGGHLHVRSEPGIGSTFEVYLPRASGHIPRASTIPPPASTAGGTETILLVEDEPLVRHMVRRALESRGYTVLEAGSGLEAVQLSNAHDAPIHLLLTDVVLPELNGREVAETLEQLRPGIRVLYMSGYPEDTQLRRQTSEWGVPFIAKPFTVTDLAAAVRGALDRMS